MAESTFRVTLGRLAFLGIVLASGVPSDAAGDGELNLAVESGSQLAFQTGDQLSMRDSLLVAGIRVLVEVSVEYTDFEDLRRKAIAAIRKKEETKYRRQSDKIFDDLESVGVVEVLGISRDSSRDDVIDVLERIDREALIGAVEAIPDASISKLIDRKIGEKGVSSSEVRDYLQSEIDKFVQGLSG